jgi:peptide deformylase
MAIRPVRIYGDPVLRQKAAAVETFDDTLRELAADMRETMRAYRGVGLAANQVGVLQRLIVVELPGEDGDGLELTLVNPELSERKGSAVDEEGCLSIPGLYDDVRRAERLRVRALDVEGKPLEFEAVGYLARVLQHEVDHLDGALFVDRLSLLKRQFLRKPLDALARGEMPQGYSTPSPSRGSI